MIKYSNWTLLHEFASKGHVELCRILMENLMDKNPEDLSGQTPFHIAASCGYLDVCRLFMNIWVDKNHVDDGVRTPLHIAAINGHVEVVGLFMAKISDKNLRSGVFCVILLLRFLSETLAMKRPTTST